MKIKEIRAENFRNIRFASLAFPKNRIFLTGENGQGKTNLLEAVSLLTALRSFRTQEQKLLVRQNEKTARLAFEIEHERDFCNKILLTLKTDGTKSVELDNGNAVTRAGDFVGRFPVVVFSSEDLKLVRGSPSTRRRWFDMTISAVNPKYLEAIRRLKRTLESRNAVLKQNRGNDSDTQLDAFDEILAELGVFIRNERKTALRELSEFFNNFSKNILKCELAARLDYKPCVTEENVPDKIEWMRLLKRSREVDFLLRATQKAPHRDDFIFTLNGVPAADYASEGQLRGIVLALGLSQLNYFRKHKQSEPVILADDVLGELDPERRKNFWKEIGGNSQIIATGTEIPNGCGNDWCIFDVVAGTYKIQN